MRLTAARQTVAHDIIPYDLYHTDCLKGVTVASYLVNYGLGKATKVGS